MFVVVKVIGKVMLFRKVFWEEKEIKLEIWRILIFNVEVEVEEEEFIKDGREGGGIGRYSKNKIN